MIPLVPELKNKVIHLDVFYSQQKRVDTTITMTRLEDQLRMVGRHRIMMKEGLVDVFGPVRVHINIDGTDFYTSALVTITVHLQAFSIRFVESKTKVRGYQDNCFPLIILESRARACVGSF